jgi:hypothetical protein
LEQGILEYKENYIVNGEVRRFYGGVEFLIADDPDGAECESSTITDSEDAVPLLRSCSEDTRVKISMHGVGGSIRG